MQGDPPRGRGAGHLREPQAQAEARLKADFGCWLKADPIAMERVQSRPTNLQNLTSNIQFSEKTNGTYRWSGFTAEEEGRSRTHLYLRHRAYPFEVFVAP